jgi:succinate dehydrogenase flavin-adding protein (antitoxin of CptAB toxin-antitoxin module)
MEDILFKKLNFKSRRGMKETTEIIKKFLLSYERLNIEQKNELSELIELDDQKIFDLFFIKKNEFELKYPNLKKMIND